MSFRLPSMPLLCNIWQQFGPPFAHPPFPRVTTRCQLRLRQTTFTADTGSTIPAGIELLVPKGTDIRPLNGFTMGLHDQVECPAGTGRFYDVVAVEDIAKGFPNEYRIALLGQNTYIGIPPLP